MWLITELCPNAHKLHAALLPSDRVASLPYPSVLHIYSATNHTAHGRKAFPSYIHVASRLQKGYTSSLYFENRVNSRVSPETGRFDSEVESIPLSRRDWTYQEQVLSRRPLYFAESQFYWECDHCRLSEDNSPEAHSQRAYPILTFSKPFEYESYRD